VQAMELRGQDSHIANTQRWNWRISGRTCL